MVGTIGFDGVISYGTFDATLAFGNTDSMSFKFQSTTPVNDFTVFSDTANTDAVKFGRSNNATVFEVKIGGTSYGSVLGVTTPLFDGEFHDVIITRSGTSVTLNIDGSDATTITATTGDINIDLVAIGGTSGDEYAFSLQDSLTIGAETWTFDGTDSMDSTPTGTTLDLIDAGSGSISTWEWVGDIVDIQKSYSPLSGGTTTEWRREGTRRRCVKGYSATDPSIKQLGEALSSVTAYNGTQKTILYPTSILTTIPCEEENFSTLAGPEFFYQIQRWVSQRNTTS